VAFSALTHLANINDNTSAQTSWATGSITFPSGALGIMYVANSNTVGVPTTTVSDSASNTWTVVRVGSSAGAAWHESAIAYFYYTSGATVTVTATFSVNATERFGWCGYDTGSSTTPLDQSGTVATTSTPTTATTSGNLTANNELVLLIFEMVGDVGPTSWPPAGYTATPTLSNPQDGTRSRAAAFAYQILSGGSGATVTSGGVAHVAADGTTAVIATFLPSGGSPPVNTVAPAVTGIPAVGQTLSASDGSWTGS
jgi:hypothetical protein